MNEKGYEDLRQKYVILFERVQTAQRTLMSLMNDLLACIEELDKIKREK